MKKQYIYAVARLRAKEMRLFSESNMRALISCKDVSDCFAYLRDHAWGDESSKSIDDFVNWQLEDLWNLIGELVSDVDLFNIFKIPNDYTNLKTAIKSVANDKDVKPLFFSFCTIDPKVMVQSIETKDFDQLPEYMRETAAKARALLFESTDAQVCDSIIDRDLLYAMEGFAKKSKNALCEEYVRLFVDVANIKVAVRGCKMKRSLRFFNRILAKCGTLDIDRLAKCAAKGLNEIYAYLEFTDYKDAVPEIYKSMARFEVWCENLVMGSMQKEKSNQFTLSAIFAYVYARLSEIKNVRMIIVSKEGKVADDVIEERLRAMYV